MVSVISGGTAMLIEAIVRAILDLERRSNEKNKGESSTFTTRSANTTVGKSPLDIATSLKKSWLGRGTTLGERLRRRPFGDRAVMLHREVPRFGPSTNV